MKTALFLLLTLGAFAPGFPPSRVYISMQSGTVRDTEYLKWKVRLHRAGCRRIDAIQVAPQLINVYCVDVELNADRPDSTSKSPNTSP